MSVETELSALCSRLHLGDRNMTPARWTAAWRALGRIGLLGASGWSRRRMVKGMETLGYEVGFNGLALSLGAQIWGVQAPLSRFGTKVQKASFLKPLCLGREMAAPAATEEEAGSDLLSMRTRAFRRAGGYLIHGRKMYVTNASLAGFFLVWARLAEREGPMSLCCFLVPRRARGVRVTTRRWSLGPPGALTGSVDFKDCPIVDERMLGREGQGLTVFMHAMNEERRFILAPAVGAMQKRLDETIERAKNRRQFGKPIGAFQAVAHKLADMRIRLGACRALLDEACRGGGRFDDERAAVVKTFLSEAWVANCLDAIAIHGAYGCLEKEDLKEELAAAVASRVMSGTNEIQKNLIAARMGLRAA